MISGVESNRPDLLEYVSCAPLPVLKGATPITAPRPPTFLW